MSKVSSIVVRLTRIGTLLSSTYTFCWASFTMVLAVQMEDTLMMIQPNRKKPQMMVTSLILFSRFFITIVFCVFRFLFHETVHSTCCRCLGLLRHTFTEVSGGESGVAFRNHP